VTSISSTIKQYTVAFNSTASGAFDVQQVYLDTLWVGVEPYECNVLYEIRFMDPTTTPVEWVDLYTFEHRLQDYTTEG
jgi:hypothetical protein